MHCADILKVFLNSINFSQYEMGHMKMSNAVRMRICRGNINQNRTKIIRCRTYSIDLKSFSLQFIFSLFCVI